MVRDPADEPPSRLSPDRLQDLKMRAEAVAAAMRHRQPSPAAPVPAALPEPPEAGDAETGPSPEELAPLDATRRSPEELAAEISRRMARWKQSHGQAKGQAQVQDGVGATAARAYVLPMHPGRDARARVAAPVAETAAPAPEADPGRWTVTIPPDYFARELYVEAHAPAAAPAAAPKRRRHYLAIALIAAVGVLLPEFVPPAEMQDPGGPQLVTPAAPETAPPVLAPGPDQKLSASVREPTQMPAPVGATATQKVETKADPVEIPPVIAAPKETTPEKTTPKEATPVKAETVKKAPVKEEPVKKQPVKKQPAKVTKPAPLVPSVNAMTPKPFEPTLLPSAPKPLAPATSLPKYTPPATQTPAAQPKPFVPSP